MTAKNHHTPTQGIEHRIDLIPGGPPPNRAAYRTNPEDTKEIQRQIHDLLAKGYVRESLSPCAVPVILVPKPDDSQRMCMDCRPINAISVRYWHPNPVWMICLMNCGVPLYFRKLICVVTITKFVWLLVTNGRRHSRPSLVSMNGSSCRSVFPMFRPPLCVL
jgi:hypothetical protein